MIASGVLNTVRQAGGGIGVALFGATYRNLFAFVLLIGFLLWLPNGLFGGRAVLSAEAVTRCRPSGLNAPSSTMPA